MVYWSNQPMSMENGRAFPASETAEEKRGPRIGRIGTTIAHGQKCSMQGVLSRQRAKAVLFTNYECKEQVMKFSRTIVFCFAVVFALGIMPGILKAEEFKIAIMQDGNGSVQAYEPLVAHLAKMGIAVTLVKAPTYQAVARMFASGEVDAIFNGPGIPGSMMVIDGLRERWFSAGFKARDTRVQQAMTSDKRWN
jgi:hypothetical protein